MNNEIIYFLQNILGFIMCKVGSLLAITGIHYITGWMTSSDNYKLQYPVVCEYWAFHWVLLVIWKISNDQRKWSIGWVGFEQSGLWEAHHTKQEKNVNIAAVMAEKGVCCRKSGVVCVLGGIPHWILECLDKECGFLLIVISRAAAFEQRSEERHFG